MAVDDYNVPPCYYGKVVISTVQTLKTTGTSEHKSTKRQRPEAGYHGDKRKMAAAHGLPDGVSIWFSYRKGMLHA